MTSKFAKKYGLSTKQESILCTIQKEVRDYKDLDFLLCLPAEIVRVARLADKAYFIYNNYEKGNQIDLILYELIKKYWDKNGVGISR